MIRYYANEYGGMLYMKIDDIMYVFRKPDNEGYVVEVSDTSGSMVEVDLNDHLNRISGYTEYCAFIRQWHKDRFYQELLGGE